MSDNKIRKLERISFQTLAPADIAAYWRACLKAGMLPKHTAIVGSPSFGIWSLDIKEYLTTWQQPSIARVLDWNFPGWEGEYQHYGPSVRSHTGESSDSPEDVKVWLGRILEDFENFEKKANPPTRRLKRKNADDRLRKLEREAASDPISQQRFIEEMVRSGKWQRYTGNLEDVLQQLSWKVYNSPWCYQWPPQGRQHSRTIGGVTFWAFANPWAEWREEYERDWHEGDIGKVIWIAAIGEEPDYRDPKSIYHVWTRIVFVE